MTDIKMCVDKDAAMNKYINFYKKSTHIDHIMHPEDVMRIKDLGCIAFWENESMVFLTMIEKSAIGNILHLLSVIGTNFKDWLIPGLRTIDVYADSQNCVKIIGYAREGWLKYFPKEYKKKRIIIEKDL